jgi:tetratricopeptide (TPR) repeat protein
MLIGLEKDAIIFTNGDNDTYPLWYIQNVEKYRTDVRVVNLSLLNTPWYIKQCRDNEPTVPITWTDQRIEGLTPVPSGKRWLLVKDLTVSHILQANDWQKPIYFAVTVPRETYEPYLEILELQGLVYKVVRRRGENMVNNELMKKNILENYKYTSILDENWKRDHSVYLPLHTRYLIQHYAWSFMRLAFIQHRDSLYQDALRSMETAHEISPQLPEPVQLLGWYYLDAGDTTRAVDFYREKIHDQPGDPNLRFRLAGVYERIGDNMKALEQLEYILRLDPDHRESMMAAAGMSMRLNQPGRARQILSEWVRRHPDDTEARQSLMAVEQQPREPPSSQ